MSTVVIKECSDSIRTKCGRFFYINLKVEVFDIQILEICFELDESSSCKFILARDEQNFQTCREEEVNGYNGSLERNYRLRVSCPPHNIYYPIMTVKAYDKTNPGVNDSTTIQLEVDCR